MNTIKYKVYKMKGLILIGELLPLKRKLMLLIFVVSCFGVTFAQQNITQPNQAKFEHISTSDGLMHNSIRVTFQDSRGYLWIGTSNGLYKYNGYEFKIYNNELGNKRSLIGNRIASIFEDSNNVVWIGTSNGLCRYNRATDSFMRALFNSETSSKFTFKNNINTIFEDASKTLWFGTTEGLYRFDRTVEGYKVKVYQADSNGIGLSNNYITQIVQDKKGLLIGTRSGLNRLNFIDDKSVEISKINHVVFEEAYVSTLLVDNNSNIWVGTHQGLHKIVTTAIDNFEVSENVLAALDKKLSNPYIKALYKGNNATIWIGTQFSGLIELNSSNNKLTIHKQDAKNNYSLKSNDISCVLKDQAEVLWVGTIRGGLSKLDLRKKKIDHYKNNAIDPTSLSANVVNAIFEDSKKNIWVGTFRKGLNVLLNNSKEKGFVRFNKEDLGSDNIHAICEDDQGYLWMGSMGHGIFQVKLRNDNSLKVANFTTENTKNALKTNKITFLYKDKQGDIWMGGDANGGLLRLTPNKEFGKLPQITQYKRLKGNTNSLTSNYVFSINEDSAGILWVGLNGHGLVKIDRDDNNNPIQYTRIRGKENNPLGLNNNYIFAIHEDKFKNIWVATFGGGLNKIPKEEVHKKVPKIIKYKKEQGLPSNEIYGILEDADQNLWISTNNGISKYDIENNKFSNLGLSDGLQAMNFRKNAYSKGQNGVMYFGGINGFNVFNPDKFKKNENPPKIELVGFKIFNKEVGVNEKNLGKVILKKNISETDEIELKFGHNSFSLEFSAMHFASPKQNKYKYMLEGYHKDWIETDYNRRFVTFSNLDSGDYVFKVKAANSDAIWNETPRELKIKVLPALWKTWWANVLYVLFAIFLMGLFRKYILVSAEYRNSIKIEKLEQSKIREVNKMKLEFFTNISHEFKTPLTLILGPLQSLLKSETTDSKLKESLLMMDRNAKHLFKLINQVMDFRKVESSQLKISTSNGDLVGFCEELVLSFNVLASEKNLNLSFESGEAELIGYFDWDKMEKILNNLISNSVKYTPDSGNIKVSLSLIQTKKAKRTNSKNEKPEVQIIVEDTGVGIPKHKSSKIFRRFYQVEETNNAISFGSGVGLALTKKLIDLLRGEIEVISTVNEGSKFIVNFPLLTKPLKNEEAKIVPTEEIISEPTLVTKEKQDVIEENIEDATKKKPLLLIVEDNPDMQSFLKSSLEGSYEILQAFDGEQGIKMALENIPNIIISDVMMPNKDGIEFCNEIKQNEITNHVPVILLTARASLDHRIEGLEVGADAYIPKPFDMRFLQTKTRKLLEERDFLKEKFSSKGITLDSQKIGINNTEKAFLEKAENIIEENLMNYEFGVEDLGSALSFSRMQLYRKFKSIRGLSANEFIRAYRIKKAALLLRETDLNVSEILYKIGFTNRSYFSKCFKQTFELSPKEYARKHRAILKEERDGHGEDKNE